MGISATGSPRDTTVGSTADAATGRWSEAARAPDPVAGPIRPAHDGLVLNPWLALAAGADPDERACAVRRAHTSFLTDGTVRSQVRSVVADSWRRSAGASVAPDGTAEVDLTDADLASHREDHPLARVMPLIRELLGTVAHDGAHLLSVCDESGRMLWVEGHPQVRRLAERMNFVAGAR